MTSARFTSASIAFALGVCLGLPAIAQQPSVTPTKSSASSRGAAPVSHPGAPPKPVPQGMVWIPGGEFSMGAVTNGHGSAEMPMSSNDAEPIHRVRVDGFWMDKTTVTNDEFEKFVQATGYVTIAEQAPTKEEFPTAPAENLVAGSVVFTAPDHEVPLNNHFQWWNYVKGANWRHPLGPESDIKGKGNYPVVHVAYPDAEAYAKWAGKRLPTEAEFEFAARGGLAGKTYVWGDEFRPKGKWMANTYQGKFPVKDKSRGWLCRHRARREISREWLRPLRHVGERLAMVQRLVPERLLRGTRQSRRPDDQSEGAGDSVRSFRTGREETGASRRFISLQRPILFALHRRHARQRRGQHWHKSSWVSLREAR